MRARGFFGFVCGSIVTFAAIQLWAADSSGRRPLPEWVTQIVEKEFPHAEVTGGHREGDDGDRRYEVKLKRKDDGRWLSVDVVEDVGVVDRDEEVRELPPRVKRALDRAFPRANVEEMQCNTDIRITYRVDLKKDGRKREVRITPQGKILEIETRD